MKINQLKTFKKKGEKIACLTAYDASFAKLFVSCGVDILLVGDSLGNVIKGDKNTLDVSIADMLYHTKIVANNCADTLVIVDMPYNSYLDPRTALNNANDLVSSGANMVKLEGGREHMAIFKLLQKNNIKICGHLGLQPQSILKIGGYKVQGRDHKDADRIVGDAKLLESWGVDALVVECIPSRLAQKISQSIAIPTIGIGAGVYCDGQVLVSYDMLGISSGRQAKFVKNFLVNNIDISGAVKFFVSAVKNSSFPTSEHSY